MELNTTRKSENTCITIKDTNYSTLSHTTLEEARELVSTNRAIWVAHNTIQMALSLKQRKRLKRAVVERANRRCYICNEVINNDTPTVDHVVPKRLAGQDAEWNLACCCQRCNADKAGRDLRDYLTYIYLNRAEYPYLTNEQLLCMESYADGFYAQPEYYDWSLSQAIQLL